MTDLPQSPSGASVTVITAQKIFAWTFDFEFLMQKANHELELSMSEGRDLFFANAMNFGAPGRPARSRECKSLTVKV